MDAICLRFSKVSHDLTCLISSHLTPFPMLHNLILKSHICYPVSPHAFTCLANIKDIDWPDRLSKSGSTLSQSGQILIDIMNDHGLEQMVHVPTREKSTLDLILTTLPGQFKDVHSPGKLSDHDIVSGTLKIFIPL